MKVAILGPGNVGQALGQRALTAGHEVLVGARDPESPSVQAARRSFGEVEVMSTRDAAAAADVSLLTVPWTAAVATAASLDRGVVVDCTNPVGPGLTHALARPPGARRSPRPMRRSPSSRPSTSTVWRIWRTRTSDRRVACFRWPVTMWMPNAVRWISPRRWVGKPSTSALCRWPCIWSIWRCCGFTWCVRRGNPRGSCGVD